MVRAGVVAALIAAAILCGSSAGAEQEPQVPAPTPPATPAPTPDAAPDSGPVAEAAPQVAPQSHRRTYAMAAAVVGVLGVGIAIAATRGHDVSAKDAIVRVTTPTSSGAGFFIEGPDQYAYVATANHVVDRGGVELGGSLDHTTDDRRGQVVGAAAGQRAGVPPERRAESGVQEGLTHVGPVGLEPTTHGLKVHCSAN